MKVAAQTLSRSVSQAIDFCREDLQLPQFQDSKATSEFVFLFDQIFDVFNSKNKFGKRSKAPISLATEGFWRPLFAQAQEYISHLETLDGNRICQSPKKTGFLGFLIAMQSFEEIFNQYVVTRKLDYLLTFKWSQDHLETFFAAIRSSLGANNNPTVRDLNRIMKRLLVHNELRGGRGQNCEDSDLPDVLTVLSTAKPKPSAKTKPNCDAIELPVTIPAFDHDYGVTNPYMSQFKRSVVHYISGYVVKMALKSLKCEICAEALSESSSHEGEECSLYRRKKYGRLVNATSDVTFVCLTAETMIFQAMRLMTTEKHFVDALVIKILEECMSKRR